MAFDMDVPMLMLDGAGPPLSNSGTLTRQDAAGHISLMLYQLEQAKPHSAEDLYDSRYEAYALISTR